MTQDELKQSMVYLEKNSGVRVFCSRNYGQVKLFPLSGKHDLGNGAGMPITVSNLEAEIFAEKYDLVEEKKEKNEGDQ